MKTIKNHQLVLTNTKNNPINTPNDLSFEPKRRYFEMQNPNDDIFNNFNNIYCHLGTDRVNMKKKRGCLPFIRDNTSYSKI